MTPCSTASELYEQGCSCTERERRREGQTSQTEKKKRHYLVFMSMGWFFKKKSAAQRYWSNISVSLVSTAINLSVSTAQPDNFAVVLTGIYRFMDHIGNCKEGQSLCYLTLYVLIHSWQITHHWKQLASHLSLFKGQSFLRCRHLTFLFQSFWKVCLACNLLSMCGYFFCCVLVSFQTSLLVADK